jgi:hypothetical protein
MHMPKQGCAAVARRTARCVMLCAVRLLCWRRAACSAHAPTKPRVRSRSQKVGQRCVMLYAVRLLCWRRSACCFHAPTIPYHTIPYHTIPYHSYKSSGKPLMEPRAGSLDMRSRSQRLGRALLDGVCCKVAVVAAVRLLRPCACQNKGARALVAAAKGWGKRCVVLCAVRLLWWRRSARCAHAPAETKVRVRAAAAKAKLSGCPTSYPTICLLRPCFLFLTLMIL